MESRFYLTCLWPGLAELWWRGRLGALPTAIAFAVVLNLTLVMRFLYPEWMSAGLVRMACWIGVAAWLFYVVRSIRELPALIAPRSVSEQPDRFPEARDAYLRGQWSESEGLLTDVLAIEARDPPALLLLAAVYRQTGRFEAAGALLDEVSRLEAADAWWLEVQTESKRLQRAISVSEESQIDNEPYQDDPADLTASESLAA